MQIHCCLEELTNLRTYEEAENDMDILLGYVESLIDHEVSAKPLLSHVDEAVHPLCNQGTTSNATRQHAQTLPLTTEISTGNSVSYVHNSKFRA